MSDLEREGLTTSRAELAARAAAREQRNKPRGFLYLGAIVLLAGLVYMMYGRSVLGGATDDRRREVNTATTVAMQVLRLERHESAEAARGGSTLDPVPNFTTLANSAAQVVGLSPAPSLSSQRQNDLGDIVEQIYQYERVTSRDLEALIGWVAEVQKMVPGAEISRLDLVPQPTQWQLSVTFVKPELSS